MRNRRALKAVEESGRNRPTDAAAAVPKKRWSCPVAALLCLSLYAGPPAYGDAPTESLPSHHEFARLMQNGREVLALEIGDDLFKGLVARYPGNTTLQDLQKRLEVADDLTKLILQRLAARQKRILTSIAARDTAPELAAREQEKDMASPPPPAQQLYWTNLKLFSREPDVQAVGGEERDFLQRYYDLRMQRHIGSIAQLATQIVDADPNAVEAYLCSLVLPLLYVPAGTPRWETLKPWLAARGLLKSDILAESCLWEMERPDAALAIVERRTDSPGERSLVPWALAASDECVERRRPDLAEGLLRGVMTRTRENDEVVKLRLRIAANFSACNDDARAAQECRQVAVDFPGTPLHGKAVLSYLGYLTRQSEPARILPEIDSALGTPQCQCYLAQLLYIKWWALRQSSQHLQADPIGQQLLEGYGDNPCTAPVLLDHAIRALPDSCVRSQQALRKLIRDFPQTPSAQQAQILVARLGAYVEVDADLRNILTEGMTPTATPEPELAPASEGRTDDPTRTDTPIPLPDVRFLNPVVFLDVGSYLRKDNALQRLLGTGDTEKLVRERYDLDTETGVELALTDMCELLRLCESEYYRTHWPKEKCVAFVRAALAEVLGRNPQDHSALLLQCQVLALQGNVRAALDLFHTVCETLAQQKKHAWLTEVAHTAGQIQSAPGLSLEQKQTLHAAVRAAGLSPDCPLLQYLEGRPLEDFEISLLYRRIRPDPFDFTESVRRLYPNRVYETAKEGTLVITAESSPEEKSRDWDFRIQILMLERDVRGLIEMVNQLRREHAPREMVIWASSLAHFLAGRSAAAFATCESALAAGAELPHMTIMNAHLSLGYLYYEQGDYARARQAFEFLANDPMGGSAQYYGDTAARFLSKIRAKHG